MEIGADLVGRTHRPPSPTSNKVPTTTIPFWVATVLATIVGMTVADYLSTDLGLGLVATSWLVGVALIVALAAQFGTRHHVPAVYWLAVVLMAGLGALLADNVTDRLGGHLAVSTLCFAVALGTTFLVWHRVERTLAITGIDTPRRETFYWLASLCMFALGTAAGDWIVEQLDLGYSTAVLVCAAGLTLVAVAYHRFELGVVAAFWIADVLTRPFGASTGDLLAAPRADGGLGLGTMATSLAFLAVIVLLVLGFTVQDRRRTGPLRSAH